MRTMIAALVLLCLAPVAGFLSTARGQAPVEATPGTASTDEAAVLAAVASLFDAMRAGDGATVAALFDSTAMLRRVVVENGTPSLTTNSVDHFAEAVGTPHEEVWDERIWEPVVQVDGPMATAWTPYAFYLGGVYSHCGVNAFQLYRHETDGWKIFQLVDTARKECDIPEAVRNGS
jgi:hypothetical protein